MQCVETLEPNAWHGNIVKRDQNTLLALVQTQCTDLGALQIDKINFRL